jgi:RNA polymerase sigma factor (sigma-70 family)
MPMPRSSAARAARELAAILVPDAPVVIVPLPPDLSPAERFILVRLPIAARIARRHARYTPDMWADLFQEACLALVEVMHHAPEDVEPDHLEALAVLWMRRRIVLALARRTAAGQRFPAHALRDWLRLRRITHQLQQEQGREPTQAELATVTGWPLARVADLSAPAIPVALHELAENEAISDAGHEREAQRHDALLVRVALARLPQPERQVVAAQFGIGMRRQSVRALACQLSISPRTVVVLRRNGIILLRQILTSG